MKASNSAIEHIQTDCLEDYKKEIEKSVEELVEVQKNVMVDYAQKCKIPLEKSNESDKSSRPSNKNSEVLWIDSRIVLGKNENSFIEDTLGDPKKLNLVFRASEHDFKAQTFHEKCDNLPHTLTIIKTEFNKRIAGYTPLTWNSAQGIAADSSGASFMLSLDCLLYTSPSPRDQRGSRMPSSA